MARPKSNGSSTSSSAIGFEATAVRDSAILKSEATLQSRSPAQDNLWLTADSRSAAETSQLHFHD